MRSTCGKSRVRLELVLVFIHRYQLTYYTKVIYDLWVLHVRRRNVVVKTQDYRSGRSELDHL